MPGDPLFGCHKGEPGTNNDLACAGWLAQFGHEHIGVRLAVAQGRLPADALEPGENWPPLHQTWTDVVRCQTQEEDHPMGKDPFFDREYFENLSPEEAVKEINRAVQRAEDWESENPDPQR